MEAGRSALERRYNLPYNLPRTARHCPAQPTRQVCLGRVAGPSANRDTTGAKVARRSAKRVGGLFLSTRG